MQNKSPSHKPGTDESLGGILKLALRKEMMDFDDMLPASIISYDRDKNVAQVQILYSVTMTDGSINPMTAPAEIPALMAGGGGIILTFDLNPGDLGWIKASDRDMSLFKQSHEAEPGNTPRIHCFEDGVFIPDVMHGFKPIDAVATCLQTLDGTTAIAIKKDNVKITVGALVFELTPTGVKCNMPITAPDAQLTTATVGGIKLVGHVHKENDVKGNTGGMISP